MRRLLNIELDDTTTLRLLEIARRHCKLVLECGNKYLSRMGKTRIRSISNNYKPKEWNCKGFIPSKIRRV